MPNCFSCNLPFEGELSKCPRCGFTFYHNLTESVLNQKADDYRRTCFRKIDISVIANKYRPEGDHYVFDSNKEVNLINAEKLSSSITWTDQKFARCKPGTSTIRLKIRNGSTVWEDALTYETPDLFDLWHVGFRVTDGFNVEVYVGNDDKSSKTVRPLSLLP